MAYYKPCKNCAADKPSCATRITLSHAIAGHYVTSINFRCKNRTPMFHKGQRVQLKWSHYELDDCGDSHENKLLFCGTVVEEKGLRFIVRVDNGEGRAGDEDSEPMDAATVFRNDNLVIKVKPADMVSLSEPDRPICGACCAYDDEPGKCHGHGEPGNWDCYWPTECIRIPEKSL